MEKMAQERGNVQMGLDELRRKPRLRRPHGRAVTHFDTRSLAEIMLLYSPGSDAEAACG